MSIKVKYVGGTEETFDKADDWEIEDTSTRIFIEETDDEDEITVANVFNDNVLSIQTC